MNKKIICSLIAISILVNTCGCGNNNESEVTIDNNTSSETATYTSITNTDDIFTNRDLEQNVDTSEAEKYEVKDNNDINITKEGIYVISGNAKNVSIIINVSDEEKVQLVLSNLTITNESNPCIYVKNSDKTFITLEGTNSLSVNGTFTTDNDTNTDAVIFSIDDLVINGTGNITINSTDNGITSKDDLKITGGTINITCVSDAIEVNNSVLISDGTININSKKDGIHVEYAEDNSVGSIYISGGNFNIKAGDDAIHAVTSVQIDGGTFTINAGEGIEATYIQINNGEITINASDDGINGAKKSNIMTPTVEINGGTLTINMGSGDTDGIDSNGNLYIKGGTISINANSPFDYDGVGEYTGGTLIVNGEKTTTLSSQMMGGRSGQGGRHR